MSPQSHAPSIPRPAGGNDPQWLRRVLIGVGLCFAGVFLILPLVNVFAQAFSKGFRFWLSTVGHAQTVSAFRLTLLAAIVSVPINAAFGVGAAWLLSRFEFHGKSILLALIDLPFAISPVVTGSMFLLLFGLQGLMGPWLDRQDLQVVFAVPGVILVTLFITFPYVVRELLPLMQSMGSEQEEAALTLGASGWKMFRRVTLPSIRWGLIHGVILCTARAIGEFGAVSIVSGHIAGYTDTLPLRVEKLYNEYNAAGAFAVASLLVLIAVAMLGIRSLIEHRLSHPRADHPPES